MPGYCRRCGAPLSSKARFCKKCGYQVTASVSAPPVKPQGTPSPRVNQPKPPISTQNTPMNSRSPAGKPAGFPIIPVLIGGGLLSLVCIGVIAAVIIFRNGKPDTVITGQTDVVVTEAAPLDASLEEEPGYQPKQPAPGETTREAVDGVITADSSGVQLTDGTRLEVNNRTTPLNITLARESNTISLPDKPDLQPSGSMRVVTFDHASVDESFVVNLTIPAAELGELDLDTVNAVRVGKYVVNGQAQPDDVAVLSVTRDSAGNLEISDGLIPRIEDMSALASEPSAPHLANLAAQRGSSSAQYVLMTFQDHLEWSYAPRLIRMVPDAANEFRHPADLKKDKDYLQKPVCNVIVLVHGHNEEENDGSRLAASDIQPWGVSYKRDVWTAYYRNFLEKRSEQAGCTAYYEFVYPTYFPAYTPLASGVVEPLGTTLAKLMKVGARNDGYLLKRMMAEKIDFNLYFVAHSMGGLVVREAVRDFDQTLSDSFQQLVTWGTPHHGSPLVTMGYLFRKGYRINMGHINRANFFAGVPLEGEIQLLMGSALTRWILNTKAQIDSPGTRDLRWDNYRPLRLDDIFSDDTKVLIINEPDLNVYNLQDGTWLYNRNLLIFNDTDPYKLQDKFSFVYGVTLKKLPDQAAETAIGATLIPMLVKDGTAPVPEVNNQHLMGASDGAVPLISMIGAGLSNFRFDYLGNVDHEEYFLGGMDITSSVFTRTNYRLDLDNKRTTCPELTLQSPTDVRGIAVDASLDISAEFKLDPALDDQPGKRIKSAEALFYLNGSKDEQYLGDLAVSDDGKLEGAYPMPDLGTGNHQLIVRAHLRDGSIIESSPTSRAIYTYAIISISSEDWECSIAGMDKIKHMPFYYAQGLIEEFSGDGYFKVKARSLYKYYQYMGTFDVEIDSIYGRVAPDGQSVSVEYEMAKDQNMECSLSRTRLKGSMINIPFVGHYEDEAAVYDVFSIQGTTSEVMPYLGYLSEETYENDDGDCEPYTVTLDSLSCKEPWIIQVELYSKFPEEWIK